MAYPQVQRLEQAATVRIVDGGTTWRSWGSGPDLILLHGSAGAWTHWARNIDALAASHTVHVPDLPGFGDSDVPAQPMTMPSLAASVLAGFDAIARNARFDLVGFSFGSVVAESIALARPSELRRLVLVRGRFDGSNPLPPAGLKRWRGILDPAELAAVQRHNLATLMFHDAARIDEQALQLHMKNSQRAVLDMLPILASRPTDALSRIRSPILAIAGEYDCFSAQASAQQESALLAANPGAQLRIIKNAGHWVNYEAAEEFNDLVLAWLNSGDRLVR
ncbi:alpha/beta fold hydrolase [Massilia cavernae]|uniref:Alpha/beta fold hydrolase n=1 Tax=Massilia cavernae TaxID=2320864 RepID=A0A418Y5P7_9BURK|nr:alpha/beta fold hydrolase [Massilia cavernae]RJG22069.1 alpha/beta fold hydrolase [Massilia cavernae]